MRAILILAVLALCLGASPATKPTAGTTTAPVTWTLRSGAPEPIKLWFNDQPRYRAEKLQKMDDDIASANSKLADDKRELELKVKEPVRTINETVGPMGYTNSRTDPDSVKEHREAIAELRKVIQQDYADIKKRYAERSLQAKDTTSLVFPPLVLALDAYGIPDPMTVIQVINKNEMIVECDNKHLWLKGVSTIGLVDDAVVLLPTAAVGITATKQYNAISGGTPTVFVAEPMDALDWVSQK